jgi:trk system potassium uptake protein TrkA
MAKKEFNTVAVIGLGGFGSSFCRTLFRMNKEVLAIDKRQEVAAEMADFATHAVCADASDENVLKKLGIKGFDAVAVCVGNVEASVFITLLCKQIGVPYVIAKANSTPHKTVLEKIGADLVVFPEEYVGEKIASTILNPTMLEIAELSPDFKIIEIVVPKRWEEKTLIELDLRRKTKVNVIVVKRGNEVALNPPGEFKLQKDDLLVLCGAIFDLNKLRNKATVAVPDEEIL